MSENDDNIDAENAEQTKTTQQKTPSLQWLQVQVVSCHFNKWQNTEVGDILSYINKGSEAKATILIP